MLLVLLMLLPLMLLKPLYNICRVRDSNPRLLDRNSCATKELHSLFRFFVIQIWTFIAFCQYVKGPNSKIFTFKCCFLTWRRGGIFQNKTLTSRRRNVNVCKSILHVDTSLCLPYLSKSARRWRLKPNLSKAKTLTWRQRFKNHTRVYLTADLHTDARSKNWPKYTLKFFPKKTPQNKHFYT